MTDEHHRRSHTIGGPRFGGPGWDLLLSELGITSPAGLPPIPPIRREQFGGVYRGRRLLKPWWRRRLTWAAILAALVVVVSAAGGLVAGHLMLRSIQ